MSSKSGCISYRYEKDRPAEITLTQSDPVVRASNYILRHIAQHSYPAITITPTPGPYETLTGRHLKIQALNGQGCIYSIKEYDPYNDTYLLEWPD